MQAEPAVRVGDVLELAVTAVAHGGSCVARHEGQVVFVRHALPGERVRARVTQVRSKFLRADCVEVLAASADRVEAPCPYAGVCGGCDWQHAALPAQRALKAAVVEEQLQRLAGIELEVPVEEVPGAPDGLDWRTRVAYAVDADGRAGFHAYHSHDVVPVDRCAIAHPAVRELGIETKRWPGERRITVAAAPTGGGSVVQPGGAKAQRRSVREHAAGRTWQVTGTGFWQVHPGAPDTLVDAVLDGLQPQPGESALDLYAGVGLFAGALAERLGPGGWVTAVESGRDAVGDARANLADLPTVDMRQGDVLHVLRGLRLRRADLVVLDPPRRGAGREVVDLLCRLQTRRTAYVTCDPAALARDVRYFRDHAWQLRGVRAFDLFPMTHHVECVAILEPA
ncbi:MAG: TRAM domain-containing protein [Streptosporangiales bacterium]|nr:TRAM domain-containing protein [Streptosporangiales bacterium]